VPEIGISMNYFAKEKPVDCAVVAGPRFHHGQRIFRYLKYTPEFGIWYSASSSLDLVGFSDADFVGCGID
jgi:hypothetical protein